jgi:Tfp pilus assembly protein PilF
LEQYGEYSAAEGAYRAAIKLETRDYKAWHNLGQILLKHGKLNQAETALLSALDNSDEPAKSLNSLGIIAARRGNKEEARDYFQRALAADPGYSSAQKNLIRLEEKPQ